METGKPGLASVPVHISSVSAQTEKRMDIQAPLTALYIHAVPALPAQPYSQPPAAAREPATLHLAMPQLYSKERLPILTLHIAGGLQSQPGLSLAAATPAARPKSAGKHVCPHCGRDCMKPSVLEKHLRCHTGERPYPCITCGVSFKTQSNLYKHKRTQAHARLSSESELSSLDSMSGSRETCISGLSLDESGSIDKDATQPAAEISCSASTANSVRTQSYVGDQKALTPPGQVHENAKVSPAGQKQMMDNEKPQANTSRHLPLQRQEATLFSKQWETSVSRGKSQSHESTDSGFSESSDHYPSPGSVLPEHSMDSLTESVKEHLEETASAQMSPGPCQGAQEPKHSARKQEQKTLEERISKLISENSAVVEDKQLENVRPRKTVLSKQGSIDLPMPYTYKDSFHFDMKISKTPNVGLQRSRRPDFYSSVPTQRSNTVEHAPLTRSNSLPFSVALLRPERSSPTSPYQSDYVTLAQRESSGHINPTGVAMKPVNQHLSTPRPLVRQTAVDGNHATDGLFLNSSVEEAGAGSLSCDGDGGDICGEPSSRKLRKKKAQKFAYNKWYMYGGGTFKKLYSEEKGGDDGVGKGRRGPVNSEHDVAQPKKLSAVHKETVTTMNFTSSSATACHPGCPPAKLKASQLHTSCSSLKTPLRRNLSLSVLPLSSIGSLVGHQTDRMSRVEAGRMEDDEKHADSTLQLCGTHVPSDRKKQKTDDKIMSPLEMGTDQNTPTRPLPSVAVTQQDSNLSCIQKNQKQTLLKGALFPRCIINANTPLVSRSPAVASAQSAAKANFLPKYQLKLPNAAEPDANASPQAVDKQTGTGGLTVNSVLSSPGAEQTSPSVNTSEIKRGNSVTSRSTCGIKNTNTLSSTRHQLLCTATTICQAETSGLNPDATSRRAAEHKHFAGTTITTTCLQNDQAGLCSTSIQPSRSAELSAPVQLSRPVGPMVTHFPAALTTANNQSSAAFSQCPPTPNPPLLHTQLSADLLSPYTSTTAPVIPCHIVPFDQMQPDAQNVFHVHTADLQICLQIISDEQLALIEPQIERQGGSVLSQRHDVGAVPLEVIQDAAQSSVAMESSNEGRGHQEQEFHQSESLSTFNTKRLQFDKPEPNLHLTEHSHSTQVTVSAESTPPVAPGSPLHPHKHSHVNKVNVTQSSTGEVMSTAASLEGAKSGRSQASAEEDSLSLSCCAEDGRPSQGGLISPTLSGQHKLSVAPLSPTTVNQSSTGGERPSKLKKQAAPCNEDTMRGTAEAYTSSRSESRETRPPQPVLLSTDEPSGSASSFSINECKASSQLNPHKTSNPVESALSEALDSSKHANMGGDRVGASEDSGPSQEITLSEDVITSSQSEKPHAQLTSVTSDIQVQRPKDVPAALASYQSPTAGLVEGCAAQKELQTRGHGQPHSTAAGKTNLRCLEGRDGEDEKGRTETDEVPGQLDKAESNSTYTCSPDMKPEGEDGMVRVDPFEQSWLSEQHLSQTHSGMSEYPPQIPQQAPSRSDNQNSSTGSSQTSLFISPPPPSDTNNLYISQHHWESSSIHNRQTEILCNTDSSQRLKAQSPDTQSAFSQAQSNPQMGTFLYRDQKQSSRQSAAPSAHPHQLSYSVQVSRAAAGSTSNHSILDNNAVLPSEPFTYPEPGGYQDDKDKAPNDYDKCQSFFLSGQIHGYQLAECLPGGIRPVPSCQDYTEDTSSSDDEGKLIIEL